MHCNQEPATILNHVEGSRNQVEVTSKIYVANSGIRNQTSTIIPVKYYHVICKSLLKLAIRIAGIKSGIKKSSQDSARFRITLTRINSGGHLSCKVSTLFNLDHLVHPTVTVYMY